jgi:DNA-binding NarL/FixJ family response regulator
MNPYYEKEIGILRRAGYTVLNSKGRQVLPKGGIDMFRTGPHPLNPVWSAQQEYLLSCRRRKDAVLEARRKGYSWRAIAAAMDLTATSVHMMWKRDGRKT